MIRVCALIAVATVACTTLSGRMRATTDYRYTCSQILADQQSIMSDAQYRAQPAETREPYERRVADCDLTKGSPDAAIALAQGWSNDVHRNSVIARAEAIQGHDDAARKALEALSSEDGYDPTFFTAAPELGRYASEEWFIVLAVKAWRHNVDRGPSLRDFAVSLVHAAGAKPLNLAVAVADTTREGGDWAVWTGLVRDARIDRDGDRTLLKVEGIDVKNELVDIEGGRVESVQHHQIWGGISESKPTYSPERRTYGETFVPNGREFHVRYPHPSESLVSMHAIWAFGRYAGRDGQGGPPVLDALLVVERTPGESTQTR